MGKEVEPVRTGVDEDGKTFIPLSTAEYKEVQKIINNRTQLVRAQLAQREKEIATTVEQQIETEFEPIITQTKGEAEKLYKRLVKLQKEIREFQAKAVVEGLSVEISAGGYSEGVEVKVLDVRKEIARRMDLLKAQKGQADINIQLRSMEASEKLILGQVTSPEARKIILDLPTVNELLPAVSADEIKALTAGK